MMASIAEIMIQVLQDRSSELTKIVSTTNCPRIKHDATERLWEIEHIILKMEEAIQTHEDFNTN